MIKLTFASTLIGGLAFASAANADPFFVQDFSERTPLTLMSYGSSVPGGQFSYSIEAGIGANTSSAMRIQIQNMPPSNAGGSTLEVKVGATMRLTAQPIATDLVHWTTRFDVRLASVIPNSILSYAYCGIYFNDPDLFTSGWMPIMEQAQIPLSEQYATQVLSVGTKADQYKIVNEHYLSSIQQQIESGSPPEFAFVVAFGLSYSNPAVESDLAQLPASIYIDNIEISAVPEPASIAMLGLAVGRLFIGRKR